MNQAKQMDTLSGPKAEKKSEPVKKNRKQRGGPSEHYPHLPVYVESLRKEKETLGRLEPAKTEP
jgi:hypothetical protein